MGHGFHGRSKTRSHLRIVAESFSGLSAAAVSRFRAGHPKYRISPAEWSPIARNHFGIEDLAFVNRWMIGPDRRILLPGAEGGFSVPIGVAWRTARERAGQMHRTDRPFGGAGTRAAAAGGSSRGKPWWCSPTAPTKEREAPPREIDRAVERKKKVEANFEQFTFRPQCCSVNGSTIAGYSAAQVSVEAGRLPASPLGEAAAPPSFRLLVRRLFSPAIGKPSPTTGS